jgi:hypothetical protein
MSTDDALDHKVAQDADHVGSRRVGAADDVAQFGEAIERRSDVKVGEDAHA